MGRPGLVVSGFGPTEGGGRSLLGSRPRRASRESEFGPTGHVRSDGEDVLT